MDAKGMVSTLVGFIISLILFIIFAVIYFIILLFVMNFAADIVFDTAITADWGILAASILTAATLLGGGALKFFGNE